MRMHALFPVLAAASLCMGSARELSDPAVFVLRERAGVITLEKQTVKEGETRRWKLGEDGFLDVVTTTGPGGSGSIVQAASKPTVEASCREGVLTVKTVTSDGRAYERPLAPARDWRTLDVRVSARTLHGMYSGFIRGNDEIIPDDIGPVEDIFAGAIPLQEGDCSVYTTTFPARSAHTQGLSGRSPLRLVKGHHLAPARVGDTAAEVVIDLAAGTTVMLRSALPPGVTIEESVMTQQSPQGVRRLATEIGGATGAVTPLGVAVIPELRVGEIVFKDASVLVMETLPPVGDGTVIGIVGIDLLARASSVTFSSPDPASWTMSVGGGAPEAGCTTLPLSLIGDRAYVAAKINDVTTCLIVDTGSPITILDGKAATQAKVATGAGGENVRGLGSGASALSVGTASAMSLGVETLTDVPVRVGNLPIFNTLRAGRPIGVLGNDVLGRFAEVRIDFDRREMSLRRR